MHKATLALLILILGTSASVAQTVDQIAQIAETIELASRMMFPIGVALAVGTWFSRRIR